jgi:hypothetical protein
MKILIEKTGKHPTLELRIFTIENDDKLIQLLKTEVKRLEGLKGGKSQLSGGGM